MIEPRVPDTPNPIEAWRQWLIWGVPQRAGPDLIRIGSMPKPGLVWPTEVATRATCRRNEPCDEAPGEGCRCGYYGMAAEAFVTEMSRRTQPPYAALGKVQLWGRTIICERGWRAEFAYPQEVYVPADAGWGEAEIEACARSLEDYRVPVYVASMVVIVEAARGP